MANNNQIYKMSNAGGFKSLTRYYDMLAGNTTWTPWSPTGAYDALATVTVPSGNAASIEFAGIPQGYKHLQIRGISKLITAAGGDLYHQITYNNDSGSNYSWHMIYGVGSGSAYATGGSSTSFMTVYGAPMANNNGAYGGFVMDILDYSNVTKNKTLKTLIGWDGNGNGDIVESSGAWYNTNAITSIKFTCAGGNNLYSQYSQFALYGVK